MPETGTDVFAGVAKSLATGFRGADQLYGFARHELDTTFVAHLERAAAALHPADRLGGDQRQARRRQRVGRRRHARLRRRANRFHARGAVDAAGLGRAHRRAARRSLRDVDAAVDGGRHDDLPRLDHGRSRRAGGPHRAVGAGRHPGGGEAHRSGADAVLRSDGGGSGVRAVRGGDEFLGAGVGVRQRHGRRAGRLDPRRRRSTRWPIRGRRPPSSTCPWRCRRTTC